MYNVCKLYIVHLSAMSVLKCPFFDYKNVSKSKIDAAAAKNTLGVPRGPSEGQGGPKEGPRDSL